MAPYRTTGEQVGHLLFRKSAILRSHQQMTTTKAHPAGEDMSAEAADGSKEAAIELYKRNEAREYFQSQKEAQEKESLVKQLCQTLGENVNSAGGFALNKK